MSWETNPPGFGTLRPERRNTTSTPYPTARPAMMPRPLPTRSIHWEVRVGTQRWATSSRPVYAQSATAATVSLRHRTGRIAHTRARAATNHKTEWTSALEEFAARLQHPVGRRREAGGSGRALHRPPLRHRRRQRHGGDRHDHDDERHPADDRPSHRRGWHHRTLPSGSVVGSAERVAHWLIRSTRSVSLDGGDGSNQRRSANGSSQSTSSPS